jgi:adenosylcobinamide-GDP ribazoletransferase
MIKKQLTIFLTAVMFLTRLPVPKNIDHSEVYLQQSPRYFPLVGMLVAALAVAVFIVLHLLLSPALAILGMMVAGIFITGAFHEDGFADTCDAFGGGWTKEKILAIMKDSRLGTYGVAGLIFILAAKFLLLYDLVAYLSFTSKSNFGFYQHMVLLMLAAHGSSRLMSVGVIQAYTYVTADDGSKSKPLASQKLRTADVAVACMFTALPFLGLPFWLVTLLPAMVLVSWLTARFFYRWIGGYTGDCLGAIQQVAEIIFYLTALVVWKFI